MEQPSNPYAVSPYAEDEAFARESCAPLSPQEPFALLVEIGSYTADGELHPNYDHRLEAERAKDTDAK
ncbi:hypothetical protein LBMAG42_20420 [Deltaproteobacteria bacterium]|nr:hypothetical protein LBMAG42_20420 [Deltaproteobacteria bacterium]